MRILVKPLTTSKKNIERIITQIAIVCSERPQLKSQIETRKKCGHSTNLELNALIQYSKAFADYDTPCLLFWLNQSHHTHSLLHTISNTQVFSWMSSSKFLLIFCSLSSCSCCSLFLLNGFYVSFKKSGHPQFMWVLCVTYENRNLLNSKFKIERRC